VRIAIAALIVVLAIGIGVLPQFTDCQSQGRQLTLENGRQIPMKCHWTGQAELALAVPLLAVGAMMTGTRRRETNRILAAMGVILGVFVMLLPTSLIGVCGSAEMICNSTMKPALLFMGALVIAASLVGLVRSERANYDLP